MLKGYKKKCNLKIKGEMTVSDQFNYCVYMKNSGWEESHWLWKCTCLSPAHAGKSGPSLSEESNSFWSWTLKSNSE